MKDVYIINNEGTYQDVVKCKLKENIYYNGTEWLEIDFNYAEIKPPDAKIVKWVNEKWKVIEEYPTEEIKPSPPTEEQQRLLDLEMAMSAILGGGF